MKNPIKTEDRTIAARLRSHAAIDAAIRAQGDEAAERLHQRHGSPGDGESAVDYRVVLANLGTDLAAARDAMLAANTFHQGQLARIIALGEERDGLNESLFDGFIHTRHALENIYGGVRGFTVVGVTGPTLKDPTGLVKQVRETVEFLQTPKVDLSESLEGFDVDAGTVAAKLAAGATRLDEVLTGIGGAKKEAEVTRLAKNNAIEEFDRMFLWVGRTLEGLFHLAGLHELAERVRPSTRRPGRRAEEDPGPGSEAPTPDESAAEEPTSPSTEG